MKWLCMYLRRIASRYWRVRTLSADTRTVKSYKRSTVKGVSSETSPLITHCHNHHHHPHPPPVVTADMIMIRISMKQGRRVSRPTGCSPYAMLCLYRPASGCPLGISSIPYCVHTLEQWREKATEPSSSSSCYHITAVLPSTARN